MVSPYLSIFITCNDGEADKLPVALVDIDNHLSKMDFTYEVFVLSGSEAVQGALKKFSKIVKGVALKAIDPDPSKISHLEMNGSYGILLKTVSVPTIDCLGAIAASLDNDDLSKTYELVLGSHREKRARAGLVNAVGRFIGSPVKLDAEHLLIGFNKNIAASVLNIRKFGSEAFDIELGMLSRKLGYKIKEIPLTFREDEPVGVNYRSRFKLLNKCAKIKLLSAMDNLTYRFQNPDGK